MDACGLECLKRRAFAQTKWLEGNPVRITQADTLFGLIESVPL